MPSHVKIGNNDYGEYLPRKHHEEDAWVFQEAYVDAFANPHVLPTHLWKRLRGYYMVDYAELHKFYKTRSDALRALERAIKSLRRKNTIKGFIENHL